ncbi:MAG: hypothetical protein K2X64_05340 [Rhodocyclaceae bacterium]|nr:hypothetical protein [Rhodocyclaceae bacterium]
MTTKQRIAKLRGHSEHLLDAFLGLSEKYALLHPMLFDADVVKTYGTGPKSRGFQRIKTTLFLSCSLELATLAFDSYEGSVSLASIINALGEAKLLSRLRSDYVDAITPHICEEMSTFELECLELLNQAEAEARAREFDLAYERLLHVWSGISKSTTFGNLQTIRNKVAAHTHLYLEGNKYKPLDISKLGVKWQEIEPAISELQEAVENVGIVVRGASFAWDSLHKNLERTVHGFWSV